MKLDNETALIESILFLESDPINLNSLAHISGLPKNTIVDVLTSLQRHYAEESYHGLDLVELSGGFMLSPKKSYWDQLKSRYGKKNENRLSRAALETLAIVAYSQPITRMEIENIRGVSPDGMIKLLLSKNLVKEVGQKDVPGKPIQYGTTKDFLMAFRLKSIAELPKLDEIDSERFELNG